MKKIIFLFLLIFMKYFGQAQPASEDSIDYIYIGIEEDSQVNVQAIRPPLLQPEKVSLPFLVENEKGVFQKKMYVLRLFLDEKNNLPLKYASYSDNLFQDSIPTTKVQGLTHILIEGIKCGKIISICPDSLEYRYTYQRLKNELARLEDEKTFNTEENDFPLQEFDILPEKKDTFTQHLAKSDWTALSNMLDIVVEKGFMSSDSRPYFRILYFRLVWANSIISPHSRSIALIPYSFAAPYLAQIYVKPHQQAETQISVLHYFASQLFTGQPISTE